MSQPIPTDDFAGLLGLHPGIVSGMWLLLGAEEAQPEEASCVEEPGTSLIEMFFTVFLERSSLSDFLFFTGEKPTKSRRLGRPFWRQTHRNIHWMIALLRTPSLKRKVVFRRFSLCKQQ